MPFNEKVNLEQYFKDEIERVSSSEIRAVETQQCGQRYRG